jgi:hypothetical protein
MKREEGTHTRLTSLLVDIVYPAIAEHGGRIVKSTGDGFLAELPNAVEAVRSAMRFQTRIKELTTGHAEERSIALRVGVNIGEVIVEPMTSLATVSTPRRGLRHRRIRRRLHLVFDLRPSARRGRDRVRRSWGAKPQEYRPPGAGLCLGPR